MTALITEIFILKAPTQYKIHGIRRKLNNFCINKGIALRSHAMSCNIDKLLLPKTCTCSIKIQILATKCNMIIA